MRVYLHADDFGLTKKITDDILECIDAGIINSVSIMANGYAFDYAINELIKRDGATLVHLHLNLDQCFPLAKSSDVKLLLNDFGQLNSGFEKLFFQYYFSFAEKKKRLVEQVTAEIKAQIEKFIPVLNSLNQPLRLDSERCSHMLPFIWNILLELSVLYNIKSIRVVDEPFYFAVENFQKAKVYWSTGIIKHLTMKVISRKWGYKKQLERKNIDFDETVFGLLHGSQLDMKLTQKFLEVGKKKNSISVQIVFHPFKPDKNEISYWDNYRNYKAYFLHAEKGAEKANLLSNSAFFKSLTTSQNFIRRIA